MQETKQDASPEITPERRRFLGFVIGASAALMTAVVALPGIGVLLSPAFSKGGRKRARIVFKDPSDANSPSFVPARLEGASEAAPGIFVKRESEGKITAFSAKCTHAGCGVRWQPDKSEFFCPCHAGRFDATGKVLGGPPTSPLEKLDVVVDGSELYVEGANS